MTTRFTQTVEASLVALGGKGRALNEAEASAVVAAVEGIAQIICTSTPDVVAEIERGIRSQFGTAAWKILAWAAKDARAEIDRKGDE